MVCQWFSNANLLLPAGGFFFDAVVNIAQPLGNAGSSIRSAAAPCMVPPHDLSTTCPACGPHWHAGLFIGRRLTPGGVPDWHCSLRNRLISVWARGCPCLGHFPSFCDLYQPCSTCRTGALWAFPFPSNKLFQC